MRWRRAPRGRATWVVVLLAVAGGVVAAPSSLATVPGMNLSHETTVKSSLDPMSPGTVVHVKSATPLPDLTSAEYEDVMRFASQKGVDGLQEVENARGSQEFAVLVSDLQEIFSGIYVDEAWDPMLPGGAKAWISINEKPSSAFIERIQKSGVSVDVRIVNQPNRERRLQATEIVHRAILSYVGTDQVVTTADSSNGMITSEVSAPAVDSARIAKEALAAGNRALGETDPKGFSVAVETVADPVWRPQTGGGVMGGCTGGFYGQTGHNLGHIDR